MTTRNFRVNNGLSVGDITIDASTNKIQGLATSAPSADGDVVTKAYSDSGTQTMTNKTLTSAVLNTGVSGTAILDEDTLSSNSDTQLATQQSIKAYVDSSISTAENADTTITDGNSSVVVADSGTGTITVSADGGTVASFAAANTTLTASSDITLSAGADVNIPANVGLTFGDDGEKIEGNGTNLTISSSGTLNITATGTTTVTNDFQVGGNAVISGNLTVNGTETILDTQNLAIEDSILALNAGVSSAANMPRFSGLHLHRGTGSTATELDLYMVWDEATNATGSTTNLGGTFTFMGSVHNENTEIPNTDFTLADIKCSTIEANLTGTATAAEYSDVAERFAADTAYEPGTVVALGGAAEITAVNEEASDEVFGVISSIDQAAFKMNGGAGNDDTHPYIAMTGRVNVKVIGTVNKGDRLISASVPGYAKAATKAECTAFNVIGRALTSKTESGQGSVLAAVRVSH
jgi:hypothetical protein